MRRGFRTRGSKASKTDMLPALVAQIASMSPPRKRGSRKSRIPWIPAFAGTTKGESGNED